jgi:cytochrome c-type biogenesis protein CcmH
MEPSPAPADASGLDALKRKLRELDALLAEGVLKGDAARAARDELERQVLAAVLGERPVDLAPGAPLAAPAPVTALAQPPVPAANALPAPSTGSDVPTPPLTPPQTPPQTPIRPPLRLVVGVAAFVLVFGAAGYAAMGNRAGWNLGPGQGGSADAGGHSADAAAGSAAEDAQIEAMIGRLAARLKDQPEDAQGWTMLGRSYTARGRHTEALEAYRRAVALRPQDAQALADYADGLAVTNNRSLEGEPEKLLAAALKLDPANLKALALAGTAAFNRGDFPQAVALWERAVAAGEPGSDFTRQLQGALDEARQRGGMPAAAAAPASGPAPTRSIFDSPQATTATASASAATATAPMPAARVAGRITLSAAARAAAQPDDTVFIFARAPSGSRMPLALLRKKVSDLPLDFLLDDSMAMSPAARLSSAQQVVVGARISKSGNAMPQPGDWQALSAPVALGAQGVALEIAEPVK